MTDKLELVENLESFALIPTSASVAEALATLQETDATFAVVGDVNHPQTLLQEDHLTTLTDEKDQPLAETLGRLPPLLVDSIDICRFRRFDTPLQGTQHAKSAKNAS